MPTGAALLAHSRLTVRCGSMKTFRMFSVSMLALVFGAPFSGVSLTRPSSQVPAKVKVAVIEFSPRPNASGMTFEARRQLQATLAFVLFQTKRFDVVDVRWTRDASQANLAAVNEDYRRRRDADEDGQTRSRATGSDARGTEVLIATRGWQAEMLASLFHDTVGRSNTHSRIHRAIRESRGLLIQPRRGSSRRAIELYGGPLLPPAAGRVYQ